MKRVFISYRRSDSAQWANRLRDHIGMRFGKDMVFQDVDDIDPGSDWLEAIRRELRASTVLLILIGRHWLIDSQGRRRLGDRRDVLRMEISEGLSGRATVIPVLVDGADMPSGKDLPNPLRALVRRQAAKVRAREWRRDVESLIERLREVVTPTRGQLALQEATAELGEMQVRYFALLDNRAADALELAQKTQAYLDRVLPLYPQDPELKLTRGYLFKNEAMALARLGRHEEAGAALDKGERVFRTMLKELPRDAGAWNGLGSVAALRGDLEKAHEYVDKALEILPTYSYALEDHEQILAQLGKKTCAVIKGLGARRRPKRQPRRSARQPAPARSR
jgi:hypothetical protein